MDEYFTRTDAGGTSTLLANALGSILALTDATGTVQTEYTYEPFGATSVSGGASMNAIQYTGRENDGTGFYYYRARYYSPTRQRFFSEDPLEFNAGDLNLYAYVFNNPVNETDPSGQIVAGLAAACLTGAATGVGADLVLGLLSGRKPTLGELAGDAGVGCLSGLAGFGLGKALGALAGAFGKGLGQATATGGRDAVSVAGIASRQASTAFGRSVESLRDALSTGRGPWQQISAHAEPATARAYAGGTSIEQAFVNTQTGEQIFRHTIVRGQELLHETFRTFSKFGL